MAFNFGISADSAVRNTRRPLTPWNIHDVKFMGCEIKEFDGKKDPTAHYKVLSINFENEDGYFSVTKFFPKAGDDERREFDSKNGGKVVMPSNFETLMAVVKQTAQVLNPAGFEKMQAASSKFKSFDDVAKALITITEKVKGTETKLKLIGRNRDGKVVADIPRIVGINKQGESFISDNYIGDKLFFSDYEEGERQKYLKAKPTEMKSEDPIADVAGVDQAPADDLDITDLL
jgi:hypothetical protein